MTDLSREVSVARRAVFAAGRACAAVQKQIAPETLEKKDKSPVTIADYAAQAIVCRALKEAFPDDPVIAEEDAADLRSGEKQEFLDRAVAAAGMSADDLLDAIDHGGASEYSDRFWTLDPIDGTKGFLRRGQYAVSLALVVEGQVVLGAVGCPNLATADGGTGSVFVGATGHEVSVYGAEDGEAVPIAVTTTADPAAARFCESVESGHSDHDASATIAADLGITAEPVRMDSQAKYCALARGDADIYLRLPTRPGYVERIWDHAGGAFLVEQAGGKVTDVDGKPLDFSCGAGLENNRGVVATNGLLHDRVLAAVAAAGV
ncbi:MAG: 3'(2'),5'-bisphosphate nucleotidase [Planctomycetota bacterium]